MDQPANASNPANPLLTPRDRRDQGQTPPLMWRSFEGRSIPDPGKPARRAMLWGVAIALIAFITLMQQCSVLEKANEAERIESAAARKGVLPPLGAELDQPDLATRLVVKMHTFLESGAAGKSTSRADQTLAESIDPLVADDLAHSIKLVPGYVELHGAEEGLDVLDDLALRARVQAQRAEVESVKSRQRAEAMQADIESLRQLYELGSDALPHADRDRITQRLGWPGRLALVFDKPSDPQRGELTGNGGLLLGSLVLLGLTVLAAFVAGCALCIVAIVKLSNGTLRPRMDRPAVGGSLGVEMLVVFLSAFAGLKLLMTGVELAVTNGWLGTWMKEEGGTVLLVLTLLLQWCILPLIFVYPRWRGESGPRLKRLMGWHRGEGVLKEAFFGVLGYLALLPLYLVAILVALVLLLLQGLLGGSGIDQGPAPVNPIAELITQSWWMALLVGSLAVVWAPIVEESVFRGAMFRQLYARMPLVLAGLISGTVFAMMHGYPVPLFPPLIALGTGFAILRWWRGSLISAIAAHALHNGFLVVVMALIFGLLK